MEHGQNKPGLRIIALHLGVSNGPASKKKAELASQICDEIMLRAQTFYDSKENESTNIADWAAVEAVKLMENDCSLNCGYGSNLNIDGEVECDASFMSGARHIWAGIGAVGDCKNPIALAKAIHDERMKPRPLGLVQPNLLVATGASKWMRAHCPELRISGKKLVSTKAFNEWQKHKAQYDLAKKSADPTAGTSKASVECIESIDTVGAFAVTSGEDKSCAVSSGGLILKHNGRLGHAAIPGGGCWTDNEMVAVTTGTGENLSAFAESICDELSDWIYRDYEEREIDEDLEEHFEDWYKTTKHTFGYIATCGHDDILMYAHNGQSMTIAYKYEDHPTVVDVCEHDGNGNYFELVKMDE